MTGEGSVRYLKRPDGNVVAYATCDGRAPTIVFLGGFRSDMTGTKALALETWSRESGHAYLRFDYLGHGQSSGRFEDGTIGRWLDDSLSAIDSLTSGKLVLVGSSMGGWLPILAARARPERLSGLVLIAAAPDFTERMLLAGLSPDDRIRLERNGRLERPSQYSPEPSVFTWQLIEEGRNHLLRDKPRALPCPVSATLLDQLPGEDRRLGRILRGTFEAPVAFEPDAIVRRQSRKQHALCEIGRG